MTIRTITAGDADGFYRMMCLLDEETEYMMYEPGERQARTGGPDRLRAAIEAAADDDLILAAFSDEGEIAGFLWAERGKQNRVRHTAYIVAGIRRAYRRQGIGTEFFNRLDGWAKENGVVRLELTVECDNAAAKSLYEKQGFSVEGIRPKSMRINGRFADEYYMGKIIG